MPTSCGTVDGAVAVDDRRHHGAAELHLALEFELNTWVPEWNRRIGINFEDNAIVTDLGVEYLSPIDEKIIVIR